MRTKTGRNVSVNRCGQQKLVAVDSQVPEETDAVDEFDTIVDDDEFAMIVDEDAVEAATSDAPVSAGLDAVDQRELVMIPVPFSLSTPVIEDNDDENEEIVEVYCDPDPEPLDNEAEAEEQQVEEVVVQSVVRRRSP